MRYDRAAGRSATDGPLNDQHSHSSPQGRTPIALIVDDHEASRELMAAFLTSFGFASEQAGTMEDCVMMAATGRFDVVLLDLHLGDINGLGLAKFIARLPGTEGRPILMVSGDIAPTTLPPHVDGWLTKPYSPRALHAMLIDAMARRGVATPASDAGHRA